MTGQRNHRDGNGLPEVGMLHAEHGRFKHTVERIDLGFDLLRINVVTALDDQILFTADDVKVTVGVDLAKIAGNEITIGAQL